MKLTSNYSKHDWKKFFVFVAFMTILIYIPAFLWFNFVIIPTLDEFTIFMEYVNKTDLIENYLYWLDYYNYIDLGNTSGEKITSLLWFLIGTLTGAVLLSLVALMSWFLFAISPIRKLAEKLKLEPQMKLVLFWNGKRLKWK